MKKTLIALMALAGVACGADEVTHTTQDPHTRWTSYLNKGIAEAITTTGYKTGDAFTLNFTVTWNHVYSKVEETYETGEINPETGAPVTAKRFLGYHQTGTNGNEGPGITYTSSQNILTLASFDNSKTWGIFTQAASYVAMENTTTNGREWVNPTGAEGTTYTWTSTSTSGADLLDSWVSRTPSNGTGGQPGIVGMSVNVDVNADGSTITLGMANGVTSIIQTAYVLDANQLAFTSADIGTSDVTFVANNQTVVIPEPATATLSLLALAGLAARRRRK